MAEEKRPLIEVKNLKKYFQVGSGKTLHAVDDVSFSLEKGQTLGLVGESGCGKSTVGTVIMRLQDPTSGELLFEGKDIFKCKNRKENLQYCKEMQIVFQDPYSSLNPKKTIRSILSEGYLIHHTVSKKDLNDVLALLSEKTGISKDMWDQYPHELDGGKRQVVGIARALSMNPKFIVCDEPVSSLDVSVQAKVLNLLMDLQKEMNLGGGGGAHDLSDVKHISERIAVMYLGQIVETADKETLFADTRHPYSIALLSAIPKVDVENKVSRIVLKGDVPSPINPKPVCRFANRCWMSQPICFEQEPELKEVSPGHCVKCHFAEKSRELMIGAEKTGLN